MRRIIQRGVLPIALAAFVVSAALGIAGERWYATTQRAAERERVQVAVLPYANTVTAAVGRHVSQMAGLKAFVESCVDSADLNRKFDAFSDGLMGSSPGIRAIQVIRDGRIFRVHPVRTNLNAVGLDLRNNVNPQVREDFERARASTEITVFGPTELVQGGKALVIDQRIRTSFDPQLDLVAMLLDLDALLLDAHLEDAPPDLALELLDRRGVRVGPLLAPIPADPVLDTVFVRDGNWLLRAGPVGGWDAAIAPRLLPVRIALVAIVVLITMLVAQVADRDARLRSAVGERTASLSALAEERSETIRRQQEAEKALAANEERLRLALAASKTGTFELEVATGRMMWSPEVGPMYGLPTGGYVESLADLMPFLDETDATRVRQTYERGIREPSSGAIEFRTFGADGVTRWLGATWISHADHEGVVRRFVGTLTDITERKSLEEQFLHAQKMQAVGSLAGGIAHDFNNLLSVILGAGQMALEEAGALPAAASVRSDIEEVLAAGARASVLTGQLLAFSRRQVVQPRLFDAVEHVRGMSVLIKRLVGERILIETELPADPVTLFADQGQLTQVVMNLAVNARDAMPDGGTLRITLGATEIGESHVLPGEKLAPGTYAVLSVIDTGEGIDPAIQQLVFDPFFTTKPVGQGTGLGLSTVYGIVVQLGGAVRLASAPDQGSTFSIYIPVADGTLATDPGAAFTAPSSFGRGRAVLVAEDEPALQRLASRVLTRAGFVVLVAEDGEAALDASRDHRGEIALLLSDVVMPRMGGLELASSLLAERPALRVLFMSGYARDVAPGGPVSLADTPFLAKPFTPRQLLDAVRRALDEG